MLSFALCLSFIFFSSVSLPFFRFLSVLTLDFPTDNSRTWPGDTQCELITARNMSYLGLVDGFAPFLLLPESLRDFGVK